jgi:hypothetical protein
MFAPEKRLPNRGLGICPRQTFQKNTVRKWKNIRIHARPFATESTLYVELIPILIDHADKMTKEAAHAAKIAVKLA